jgi:superfamily II DNA or RNA helicase
LKLITNNQNSNFYQHISSLLKECDSFIFNVAFINFSGVQLLLDIFKQLDKKGIKGKILSSTYLNFTEVKALEKLKEFKNIELKIYDNSEIGFHAKAYIFEFKDEYKIILGSSNLTSSAFKKNIEWNLKTIQKKDEEFANEILNEFNQLWQQSTMVDETFLNSYKDYKKQIQNSFKSFSSKKQIFANSMQEEALVKLNFLRQKGETKALAIAATGSGKTYLSALDVKAFKPKKILFIVHRENILLKAKQSFEALISDFSCGLFTGNKKENSDYLFATIQTLSTYYENFKKDEFEYIIVDEAHHIASPSYEKVMDYFNPKFLLGLTATPNRMDKTSIYEIFDENIACDIRLNDALEFNLISPFHYFGISDIKTIDYSNINLNDIQSLAKLLMVNSRVDFIIEKMNFYGYSGEKRKVLGFCVSKEHAKFMSEEFNKKGVNSTYLTSNDNILHREKIIERLEDEKDSLEVIFSVDIFNEGVDIPSINTCLMLRPTNSPIVFTQQLGRGLRKAKGKEFLTLLDFIGNHNRAYLIAIALNGNRIIDKESIKFSILNDFANMKNAHILMDEISKNRVLEQINKENFNTSKYLKEQYYEFKANLGNKIPMLVDYINFDEFISPLNFISDSKSYIEFLKKVEIDESFKLLCDDENFLKASRFLQGLLPIKRVYEFAILKYLISNESCDIENISKFINKYLEKVSKKTIEHAFSFLNQEYFDSAQISRFLKLVELKDKKLFKTKEFEEILKDKRKKEFIEDSLNYGILSYEESFGIKDYGMPFLKLYEKYNMLNIAQLCNFNKIHSSFRGSGFLKFNNDFFLFITLEKDKYSKASKYINTFFDKQHFSYVSKPSHSQEKGDGQRLCDNKKYGVKLHIFIRKFSHVDKKVQPFIYLGLANCVEYKENKPIKTVLKLENSLSDNLYCEFTKIL